MKSGKLFPQSDFEGEGCFETSVHSQSSAKENFENSARLPDWSLIKNFNTLHLEVIVVYSQKPKYRRMLACRLFCGDK